MSSLDKNFMVPVSGALVYTVKSSGFVNELGSNYPGRASNYHVMDFIITMLEMGVTGLENILNERKEAF